MEIQINEKYKLVPLLELEKDDLSPIFEKGRGMYIVNFPEQDWYDFQGFKRETNYSIEKKQSFFNLMDKDAKILSLTQDVKIRKSTRKYNKNKVVHFGSIFTGRFAQISMAFQLLIHLIKNRKRIDYLLCYNFHPAEMVVCAILKFFFSKKIVLDFEDDYLVQSKNPLYSLYFNMVKHIPDTVICINRHMKSYFSKETESYVFNGFIDIEYMKKIAIGIEDNYLFLYAGALDNIRGIDLIPDLVLELRKILNRFKIVITGNGILKESVQSWSIKEVEFLGFLSSEDYENIIKKCDACLVLQKPDHPFSRGSYPSKIEFYSKYKKQIFKTELI